VFLRITRSFERTAEFEQRIVSAPQNRKLVAQAICGDQDPIPGMADYAPEIFRVLGIDTWHQVRGKHFLQEDSPQEIADLVEERVRGLGQAPSDS